jgi:hypothetical protein
MRRHADFGLRIAQRLQRFHDAQYILRVGAETLLLGFNGFSPKPE